MNNRLVDFLVRFQNRRQRRSLAPSTPKSNDLPLCGGRASTKSSSAGNFDLTILSSKVVLKLLNKLSLLKLLKFKVIREDAKDSCLSFSRNLISKLELISTPSRPVSKSHIELLNDAKLKKGGAFYILSNSEFGLLSSLEALERKVGGKLILLVHVG
tara:strand:+ start:43 stop:513 length:471 start_codon:yes stop_codon:yes gene_type:complete